MAEIKPDEERHYWMPVPHPDGRRHAFRGARRWPGDSAAETVCGETVPLAVPSEMDWVTASTCAHCWSALIADQGREPAGGSWRTSARDREIASDVIAMKERQ